MTGQTIGIRFARPLSQMAAIVIALIFFATACGGPPAGTEVESAGTPAQIADGGQLPSTTAVQIVGTPNTSGRQPSVVNVAIATSRSAPIPRADSEAQPTETIRPRPDPVQPTSSVPPTATAAPDPSPTTTTSTTAAAPTTVTAPAGPITEVQIIDARDFGAKGDGSTDDTAALQAAMDAAALKTNAVLWLGDGEFVISDTLRLTSASLTILGSGWTNPTGYSGGNNEGYGTSIRWNAGSGGRPMIEVHDSKGVRLENFRLEGATGPSAPSAGIRYTGTSTGDVIDRLWIGVTIWSNAGIWTGAVDVGVQIETTSGDSGALSIVNSTISGARVAGTQSLDRRSGVTRYSNVNIFDYIPGKTSTSQSFGVSTNNDVEAYNLFFFGNTGADVHTAEPTANPKISIWGYFSESAGQFFDINSRHAQVFVQGGYAQLLAINKPHFIDFYPAGSDSRLEVRDLQLTHGSSANLRMKPDSSSGLEKSPALILWNNRGIDFGSKLDVGLIDRLDSRALLLFSSSPDSFTFDHLTQGDQLSVGRVSAWPANLSPDEAPTPPLQVAIDGPRQQSLLALKKLGQTGRLVDVRSFGAVGDGQTDDTSAFKAAVAHLLNPATSGAGIRGGVLWLGDGDYVISDTIRIHRGAIQLVGSGWTNSADHQGAIETGAGTIVRWRGEADKAMFEVQDSRATHFENFRIIGDAGKPPLAAVRFFRQPGDTIGTNEYNSLSSMWIGDQADLQYGILVDGENGNNDQLAVVNSAIDGTLTAGIETRHTQSVWNHYSNITFNRNRLGISTNAHFSGFNLSFNASTAADLHTIDRNGTAQMWVWGYQSAGSAQLMDINSLGAKLYVQGGTADISNTSNGYFLDFDPAHSISHLELRDLRFLFTGTGPRPRLRVGGAQKIVLWDTTGLDLSTQLDVGSTNIVTSETATS